MRGGGEERGSTTRPRGRFHIHKEEDGELVKLLGMVGGGHPPLVIPKRDKYCLVLEASRHFLTLSEVEAEWLECLVSHWTWCSLLSRASLAVWDQVYAFIQVYCGTGPRTLWPSCKRKIGGVIGIGVFLSVDLTRPWSLHAHMTDACLTRGVAVYTEATQEELRAEARLACYGGWQAS